MGFKHGATNVTGEIKQYSRWILHADVLTQGTGEAPDLGAVKSPRRSPRAGKLENHSELSRSQTVVTPSATQKCPPLGGTVSHRHTPTWPQGECGRHASGSHAA